MWPSCSTRTFWALMVMPRSRSMSMESRYCSRIRRGSTAPVSSRMRSERVDLPWSTWLMMEKLRMRSIATGPVEVAEGGTVCRSYRSRSAPPVAWPGNMAGPGRPGAGRNGAATCYSCPPHRWTLRPPPPPFENTEDRHVANIKSQIKRNRQNEKRRLRNKSVRAELRTRTKNAVTAAESGAEDSAEVLRLAVKRIDKAAAQRRDPQEHGGEPQVPARAADRRDRGGRRVVDRCAACPPRPTGCALPVQVEGEHLLGHDACPQPRRASSSHSRTTAPAWAGTRRAWPDAGRRAGSSNAKISARPCTVTARSSPGRWVALTAGRTARWRMRTESRPELNQKVPCRK